MLALLLAGKSPAVGSNDPSFASVKLQMLFNGDGKDVKGHTMTGVGSPTFVTDGHGTAVNLRNQLSYYTTPNGSDFDLGTNDWTIEAFVNPLDAFITFNDYGIYYQGENTSNNQQVFSFEATKSSSNPVLRLLIRGTSGTWADLQSTTVLPYSTWSHVAAVRQGSTLSLYQAGNLLVSQNVGATAVPYFSGYPVVVGARSAAISTRASFPGLIDSFRQTNGVARYAGSTYTIPNPSFS